MATKTVKKDQLMLLVRAADSIDGDAEYVMYRSLQNATGVHIRASFCPEGESEDGMFTL